MQSLSNKKEAIAIDTPEGLRDFLLYVEEVHTDLLEIKETTFSGAQGGMTEFTKGLRAYAVCKEVIERCLTKRSVSNLEVEQLQTLYNEMLSTYDSFIESQKGDAVANQRFTGRLAVGDDALEFKSVKIKVKQKEEEKSIEPASQRVIHSQLHPQTFRRRIEQKIESRLTKSLQSVIARYEANDMVVQWFGSVLEFEAFLEAEIMKMEKPSKLHSFLKIKHASAFSDLLMNMTVLGVEEFDAQKRETIKTYLEDNNIEYETYVMWIRHLSKMKQMIPDSEDLTFAELFIIAQLVLIEETSPQTK